jgi:hypothetical protein
VNFIEATKSYEQWLAARIPIVSQDLETKHVHMGADRFAFLRATYYRWAQLFPELEPTLAGAPGLLAVGDLHVENFGTWRDERSRPVWGVNDFDERERLPYTNDLVRLGTSALLAVREERLALKEEHVCAVLLEGYRAGLEAGGQPFALESRHRWLAELVAEAAKAPERWWRRLEQLPPAAEQPAEALALIQELSPGRGWEYTVRARAAGLGSRGHRRLVAVGPFDSALEAREVKQLAPPAGVWLGASFSELSELSELPAGPGRAADPLHVLRAGWVGRRLAPDTIKLDLADYPRRADRRLLHAMGFETANIHLCNGEAISDVRLHVDQLTPENLTDAARRMAARLEHDWHEWRQAWERA